MKAERLKELIEKFEIIFGVQNQIEGMKVYKINLGEEESDGSFSHWKIVNNNRLFNTEGYGVFDFEYLYETKSEAEFVAEFGNVEKVVKMPVPPTWEEQSKIKVYGYFDIIKLGDLTLNRRLPISKAKGKFFVEKAYSKDFYTFEYTKQGYITALRKMVELFKEEV